MPKQPTSEETFEQWYAKQPTYQHKGEILPLKELLKRTWEAGREYGWEQGHESAERDHEENA